MRARSTHLFVNRVRGTANQDSRRSWNSSTGGAGIATGTRPGPIGCRTGWRPGVPRRAGTAWPGRRTGRTRRRTLAADRWATRAVTATTATRATGLPSPSGRYRRYPPLPQSRRTSRRRRPVLAASTALVVRTTAIPCCSACGNTQRPLKPSEIKQRRPGYYVT